MQRFRRSKDDIIILCMRLSESRSSPPPHRGGLQLARKLAQPSAVGEHLADACELYISINAVRRTVRAAASPRGGPLFAFAHSRGLSAGRDPKFAPKISKNPPKTRKITKKACKLLYDTIICTTFGASDPSKCDVNRIAVVVNLRNLQSDSNKRMSYFGS